jgi:hypothetical protein
MVMALAAVCVPAWAAGPLEGRWVLTEQTYQGGGRNLAPEDGAVRFEFFAAPGGIAGRLWTDADPRRAFPWPAIVVDGRPLAVTVRSIGPTPAGGISVTYLAVPAEGDDMVLEVRETYEPVDDGAALAGTVEVRFTGGEFHRGGYTLHRRLEREP